MPKPIPFPTRLKKDTPEGELNTPAEPELSGLKKVDLSQIAFKDNQPEQSELVGATPSVSPEKETKPDASPEKTEKPSDMNEENCVVIGGQKIEIKPTKLKYFRNHAASGYGVIKAIPLHDLLTYGKGVIDQARDADQLLYDFLVAVFDDSSFVRDNYDNMDAEQIEQIIKIFGRINHVNEKEEAAARKNREAQAKR